MAEFRSRLDAAGNCATCRIMKHPPQGVRISPKGPPTGGLLTVVLAALFTIALLRFEG